jgi:hypothetical protein
MFSKFFLIVFCSSLITCSKENRAPNPDFEVKLKKGECISRVGEQLEDYFEGRMSRPQVVAFWDCMANAILEFQRLTSGENGGDKYSPQALQRFLREHFTNSRELSNPLVASAMELKRVLLSGSNLFLTRDELTRLQDLLIEMKLLSLELHPHVKVIFGDPVAATDSEVDQAGRAVAQAASRLGAWLDRNQQPYEFKHLEAFFTNLADWMLQDADAREMIRKMGKLTPALASAKRLLVAGSADKIEGPRWVLLIKTLGQIAQVYLDFRHAFKDDLNSGMIRGLMPEALNQIGQMLELAIQRRNGAGLPFSEWEDLFEKVEKSKVLSKEFTVKSLKPALEWLVIRGLSGGVVTDEFALSHVRQLQYHYSVWRQVLDRVNGQAVPQSPEWQQFEAVLARTDPINWDAEARLEHNRKGPATWTQANRRRLVWPFFVLHWLKTAYVGSNPTVNEAEMMGAVKEVLPMLQNFGWLTGSKLSIGKRLVREADLFLYPSNGDSFVDLPEATHYLAFVASSFRIAELWLDEAEPFCPSKEAMCVRKVAARASSRVFEPMPDFRSTVLSQPVENFVKYMKAGEETILGKAVTGPIGTADILQVMMLLQYVEVFLNLYDITPTQKIDLAESLVAYQKYGPTLSRLLNSRGLPPDEVLAFYTFMMKNGETPFSMFGGAVHFVNWKLKRNDWAFEAERPILLGILNQLSKL